MPKSKCIGGRWGYKVLGKTPGLGGGFSTCADIGSHWCILGLYRGHTVYYSILQYNNIFYVLTLRLARSYERMKGAPPSTFSVMGFEKADHVIWRPQTCL